MIRVALVVLSLYGIVISRKASRNIELVAGQAAAGSDQARHHFTQTRYAHLLGPKNSDLGMLYYAVVALAAASGLTRRPTVLMMLRLASATTVAMSLYLLWALLFRLRVRCPMCLQGHAINAAMFGLLLLRHGRT